MAESEKRGFFGRLFGGKKEATPTTDTDVDTGTLLEPTGEPAEENSGSQDESAQSPQDLTADGSPADGSPVEGRGDDAVLEEAPTDETPAEHHIDHPLVMPMELAPIIADDLTPDEPAVEASAVEASGEETCETEPEAEAAIEPEADAEGAPAPLPVTETTAEPRKSWFQRLREGLARSSSALGDSLNSLIRKRKLDAETLEELEDLLIQADLGADTAVTIAERLAEGRFDKEISEAEVRKVLAEEIEKVLEPVARPLDLDTGHKPHVVLLVGVNGTGKTTTIGKLSAKLTREGKKVMLAAGDTFRAAAVEQLKIWGDRTGSPVVARETGADAAGLVFDAMKEAKAQGSDVLLIDTAGRLQNRAELMAELEKVVRVIKKHDPQAPHTVLLTLDATTGQNAMNQVEIFGRTAGVTGLVMTKLDGTARGGILVAIAARHGLPVHFIGVGEGIDDLEPFTASEFASAIAGTARG